MVTSPEKCEPSHAELQGRQGKIMRLSQVISYPPLVLSCSTRWRQDRSKLMARNAGNQLVILHNNKNNNNKKKKKNNNKNKESKNKNNEISNSNNSINNNNNNKNSNSNDIKINKNSNKIAAITTATNNDQNKTAPNLF
ncbi:hypothetical protein PoB_000429500 [Plakobranchus ocellatus]|uniref:Uncharacterized protein n=1 Tax=Plakobranchus ocellatus TaxID=259542 RepID=A0AAV3Y4S0_9GAST|nr:hypothetical protein PoB_000429500 [Plakobranchus ocellatus]